MFPMSRLRDEHNDRTLVERVDPLMGSVVEGRYRVDFRLASGGFGAIYRATEVGTNKQVALKVLHAEMASADARVIARFRREGATLAQLQNQHTINAYELGETPDGSLYIVMELLHGESLYEQFRSKGNLPWRRVAAIGSMVCSSLGEAHALGIVHRDLKPANIHLENRDGNPDFVKVLDFGIAKINAASEHLDPMELTQAGQMIGTFDYMAPEQMVGGACTGVTDIYTLGVVLYEMVCGRRPFADASNPTAMLAALLTQSPPPLDTPGVPDEFERILMRCLEREPQNRYQTVEELAADLDRVAAPARDDGRTRKMDATPPPEIVDETTVIDHRRSKRPSTPHVVRRDEPAPTVEGRPRRQSEPPPGQEPRAKRDSSPPTPNVIRRDGSGPVPVLDRTKRTTERDGLVGSPTDRNADSGPVPVLDRTKRRTLQDGSGAIAKRPGSEPRNLEALKQQQQDPNQWQSLQLPKREPQQAVPVVRQDPPESQRIQRYAAGAFSVTPDPSYQQQFPPTPLPSPVPPMATTPDPNAAWHQPYPVQSGTPPRGTYDMAGTHSRDVMVRRVVWTIALILGLVLVIVVASRL
jgi:serine/threonine-protein kinase